MKKHHSFSTFVQWNWKTLKALPFLAALLLAVHQEARAYTDPGTGALIWQMLAAGFVGLLFYLRKFTTWFREKRKGTKE